MTAIKQTVTIGPGGRVEVVSAELPEGRQAEVIVLVTPESGPPARRLTDFLGAGRGLYSDTDDADRSLRRERDAWES
jgi:hypothetical protein